MNCQDMEKFIHVYLDREFDEDDRADFERHLADCASCRRLAAFEQRFKQQLRTSLAPPYLRLDEREALRQRIRSTLEGAQPRPASRPAWLWALIPAAGAAALLVGLALLQTERIEAPIRVPEASPPGPSQVDGRSPQAVREFYRGRLDFPVDPPRFSDRRTALLGARLGKVEAREAAHLLYGRGDQRFSVLVFLPDERTFLGKAPHRIGDTRVFWATERGRPVATFSHRGLGYSITGDLPAAELDRLVRDLVAPLPFPSADSPVDALPVGASGDR